MTLRTAATRYARALFDVALTENADLARIERDLTDFVSLLRDNPTLGKALTNPSVPAPLKRNTVAAIFDASPTEPVLAKLLMLLAERDRLVLLPDLVDAYSKRLLEHRHIISAEVTTAEALPPERIAAVEAGLARATGRTVRLSTRVNPEIIGGLIARIGGTVYDASITSHLQRMKKRLEESL